MSDTNTATLPPEYEGLTFESGFTDDDEFKDPSEMAELLGSGSFGQTEEAETDSVDMEDPADPFVELAGFTFDGNFITEAQVRELTGKDEETLAKDTSRANWGRYVSTLLECGLETLGGTPATRPMINALSIGDRDLLVMHIRRVTYGDEIELTTTCPQCNHTQDILYSLTKDVPVKKFEHAHRLTHTIPLMKGRTAEIRLPNGEDQEKVFIRKRSLPEQNSVMIEQILVGYNGGPPVSPQEMSAGDRRMLLEWVAENMPGPQYQDVTVPCGECGMSYPVILSIRDLFRI